MPGAGANPAGLDDDRPRCENHGLAFGRWRRPFVDAVGGLVDPLPVRDPCGVNAVYAIISDGPHQYRVEEGQTLDIETKKLPDDATTVEFDRVLLVGGVEDGPTVGQPVIEGARVTASVLGTVKGDKITIQKLRRRKNYRLKKGHRQKYLRVRIDRIET